MKKNPLVIVSIASVLALVLWGILSQDAVEPKPELGSEPGAEEAVRVDPNTESLSAESTDSDSRVAETQEPVATVASEPSDLERQRAARLAKFGKYIHYTYAIQRELLLDPGYSRRSDSHLYAVRLWVIKTGLTADDIRSEMARLQSEGGNLEGLILAMPYAKGASAEDLSMIRDLALSGTGNTALAALQVLPTFEFYVPDAGEAPLWDAVDSNLDQVLSGDKSAAAEGKAQLALGLMTHLSGPDQTAKVEALLDSDDTPVELRRAAFALLARAGGADGAQRALTALSLDDPAALDAVRAIRDPSVATELTALATQPLTDDKSARAAAAALSGLASAKPEAAVELLQSSILPRLNAATGEEKQQLTDLVTEALNGISDWRSLGAATLVENLFSPNLGATYGLPKPWVSALDDLSKRVTPRSFNLPTGALQDEVCDDLRHAIERIPTNSRSYAISLSSLVGIGRPEDLQYVEEHLYLLDNDGAVRRGLEARRQDDLSGTLSLSR